MSMHGICKSFNPHKGWGFVTSGDGTDYFLLKKALKGYFVDKGYEMFFNPGKDERGRLVANDIQVKLNEDPSQQIFMGQVKSYNEDSGYGFIECEATQAIHGKDVFVMGKDCINEMGMCPVGGNCKFQVVVGDKGPTAQSVLFIGMAGDHVAQQQKNVERSMDAGYDDGGQGNSHGPGNERHERFHDGQGGLWPHEGWQGLGWQGLE
eukprot:gnl/TRDRNA2_/TRDRNA2_163489_c0_seq2.p1 gnl/TRDRNA2_/TRDRNA2_163489_c0~~gnl/TRDRNA2_/TRDRNA2_163489_c0_seq2.p1  ORF type:complete len:207 (+),score=29.53 gnl/TRDRNA2_/TRDRNA2_163489_c0_seq2:102-722(+)